MSSEQFTPQGFDQISQHSGTNFEQEDHLDFHASDLVSIEVLRARADIDAAMQPAEIHTPTASLERAPLLPHQEIALIGSRVCRLLRNGYEADTFDLGQDGDEEVNKSMFNQAESNEEHAFDLTKDDDLNPDMYPSSKPATNGMTEDMFDKAA